MKRVFLRKKISNRIAEGHPWVFANEVGDEPDGYSAGSIVSVFSYNGSFVGKGYANPNSVIKIRFLSQREDEVIDTNFFKNKIEKAFLLRKRLGCTEFCSVIFSESDGLPGLILDKYGDVFVFQTLTLGIDLWKEQIINAVQEIFNSDKIFERNDNSSRKMEGLALVKGFARTTFPTLLTLKSGAIQFQIDIEKSPKTGFYWEQKNIELALRTFVKDKIVLDLFCASGYNSVHAIAHGAAQVVGIDQDAYALTLAESNAFINGFKEQCNFIEGNVFDLLKSPEIKKTSFDVVILDPPSLAKSKANIPQALSGYKELNLRAMQLLSSGGILISTCSTHLISEALLFELFSACARDCKKKIKLISRIHQPSDHPILLDLPSTDYFKGYIFEIE